MLFVHKHILLTFCKIQQIPPTCKLHMPIPQYNTVNELIDVIAKRNILALLVL